MNIERISGKKCYLARMDYEHIPLFVQWMSDPEVTFCINSAHLNYDEKAESGFLDIIKAEKWHSFVIISRETDLPVGNVFLLPTDQINRCTEMGIMIGDKAQWGKGFATEAIGLILDYGFGILNLHNIMLKVYDFNRSAIGIYRKLGFKDFAVLREARLFNGKYHDMLMMDILAREYYERKYGGEDKK